MDSAEPQLGPESGSSASGPPQATPSPEQPDPEPDDDGEDTEGNLVASLADLQLALDYIQALKSARLDESSGLDLNLLQQLQDPVREFLDLDANPDLRLSIRLYMDVGRASEATYMAAREAILERWPEDVEVLTYDQVQRKVEQLSGVIPIIHDMCINSCMAYTGPLACLEQCRVCSEPRYDDSRSVPGKKCTPRQTFYTIPIGPQLQALYKSPESARLMSYRKEKTANVLPHTIRNPDGSISLPPEVVIDDYIHGTEYLTAVANGKIKDDDIVLMISTDGAQLYEHKQSDCWIFIWIIMDLPPDSRYKRHHVIPGGFIPGPKNPKIFDSFSYPGLHHLASLQNSGLRIWNPLVDRVITSNPFLLFGTSDGPGLVRWSGMVGHNGYIGCRGFCPLHGRRCNGGKHYYPVLQKPDDRVPPGSDHPDVSLPDLLATDREAEYKTKLALVVGSETMTQYKQRRRDNGIAKPSIFSGFSSSHRFPLPTVFPNDTMHLTGLNITSLMLSIFRGTIDCHRSNNRATWDWVVLSGEFWNMHGLEVAQFRQYLPGSFDRPPRNPAKKINSGYKAQEYLTYVFGYLPGLLYGLLPNHYWQNFCKLVRGVRLILQRSITTEDLEAAYILLSDFCIEFEVLYVRRKSSRLHFVHQSIHNLFHLAPDTEKCGPLALESQWTIERVIGYLGQEIRQPSNPFKNLSQRGLRQAQLNALSAMAPNLSRDHGKPLPHGAVDLGDGYVLLRPTDPKVVVMAPPDMRAYSKYRETVIGLARLSDSATVTCYRWARLRLPNQQIARTHWKESQRSSDASVRTSRMVKLEIDSKTCFGEVMYFFEVTIQGGNQRLAMVSLGEQPNTELLQQSSNALWVTRLNWDFLSDDKENNSGFNGPAESSRKRKPDLDEGPGALGEDTALKKAKVAEGPEKKLSEFLKLVKKNPQKAAEELANLRTSSEELQALKHQVLELIRAVKLLEVGVASEGVLKYPKTPPAPKSTEEKARIFWTENDWKASAASSKMKQRKTTIADEDDEDAWDVDVDDGEFEGKKSEYTWLGFLRDIKSGQQASVSECEAITTLCRDFFQECYNEQKIDVTKHTYTNLSLVIKIRLCIILEDAFLSVSQCELHWKYFFIARKVYNSWRNKFIKALNRERTKVSTSKFSRKIKSEMPQLLTP
ncbi:hypothetical protein EST38_g13534, partial [Candolleomyces aberdarensis]